MRLGTLYKCFVLTLLAGFGADSVEEIGTNKRQSTQCDPQGKYRDPYSYCNNLNTPVLGSAYDVLARSLPPDYDDKKGTPRLKATDGTLLSNPRIISTKVHFERKLQDNEHSTMLMQWGQFINHDMVATPNTTDSEGDIRDCCKTGDDVRKDPASPCFSIFVGPGDPYFLNGRCINFVRSEAQPGTGTEANPRNTFNGASAFIDGSHIYGPYPELEKQLRETTGGRLKTVERNGKSFPPPTEAKFCLNGDKPDSYCFLTGDIRVNVFVGLSAMHTVFLREHNRLVALLAESHPALKNNPEKLFQEAKKIVAAELQIITYNDWLPLIIGPDYMKLYSIASPYQYLPTMNPRITNAFATSAMRFGHSMVPDSLVIGGQKRNVADLISTTKEVLTNIEDVLNSITGGVNFQTDPWFVNDMTRFMFETKPFAKDGYDIVSLNIQRGRDHGVSNYNKWRDYCKLGRVDSFSENYFFSRAANDMKNVYKAVDDIDLFSGAMSEWHVPKGVVGDLNACLIAEQFMRVKFGDRFFWQTPDENIGFNQAQQDELKKVSLARIICDNTNIGSIQRNVFLKPDASNPRVSCGNIPVIDLTKW